MTVETLFIKIKKAIGWSAYGLFCFKPQWLDLARRQTPKNIPAPPGRSTDYHFQPDHHGRLLSYLNSGGQEKGAPRPRAATCSQAGYFHTSGITKRRKLGRDSLN